jgi:OOP family OmpA-OmpF porin
MSVRKTLLGAAAVVLLPLFSQAQPINGLYLGAGAGVNFLNRTDITGTYTDPFGPSPVQSPLMGAGAEFDWGFVGVVGLGWGFGNGLRAEIEGNYRQNDTSSYKYDNIAYPGANGTAMSYGAMLNVLYDIDLGGMLGGLTPYVGAGVGAIWHEYKNVGSRAPFFGTVTNIDVYNGTSSAFAGQAIAGLSLPISTVPGLSATAEYRYIMTAGHNFDSNTVFGINLKASADVDNVNHSLLIGLRYAFNAAPAMPVAAAPVAAARTFLVFFDWSKADLTDRARQIIGEAAAARGQGVTRIEVNGFTDRSGPADYNMGLSQRRANAVAAELVRRGVPRNEIVTRGFGEENNLVPTADGVREPQNRRVEIILR